MLAIHPLFTTISDMVQVIYICIYFEKNVSEYESFSVVVLYPFGLYYILCSAIIYIYN
jgi:hypothetical protein